MTVSGVPLNELGVPGNWHGVPPCWRAYFFLLRQEKVAKKKATPRSAPCGFLPLLGEPGGCGTRATPSNSPRRLPPARLRCSAPLMGTRKASTGNQRSLNCHCYGQPEKKPKIEILRSGVDALLLPLTRGRPGGGLVSGPLERCRATQAGAEKGRALFEGVARVAQPPRQTSSAGNPKGTDPGSPSFCLLFLGEARKSKTPRKGGTPSQLPKNNQ